MADQTNSEASTYIGDGRQSARKRRAILESATTLFLQSGYLGTSMDEIAALAGVSKQTVYKHFEDKQRLFTEIVITSVNEVSDPNTSEVQGLGAGDDVGAELRDLARGQLTRVLQPKLLQLRRLVIAESGRFPQLGRVFYERGPGRTIAVLASAFERLAAQGRLRLDDPMLAAAHFNWLIMSIPLNEAMLLGDDAPPALADLDRYAATGVAVFLAAYGRGLRG